MVYIKNTLQNMLLSNPYLFHHPQYSPYIVCDLHCFLNLCPCSPWLQLPSGTQYIWYTILYKLSTQNKGTSDLIPTTVDCLSRQGFRNENLFCTPNYFDSQKGSYSCLLRTHQSRNQFVLNARFSACIQTCSGAHLASSGSPYHV